MRRICGDRSAVYNGPVRPPRGVREEHRHPADRLPRPQGDRRRRRRVPVPAQRQHPARRPAPGRRARPVPHARRVGPRRLRPRPRRVHRASSPRSPSASRCAGGSNGRDQPHRVALFVSKYDHCLVDLLYRHQSGELPCDIPLIVSNHPDAKRWADFYGVPFHVIPVEAGNKAEAERQQLDLLARAQDRPRGPGPLHAGAVGRLRGPLPAADHQRASLVPAGVQSGPGRTTGRSSAA